MSEIKDQEGFWAGIFFILVGIGGLWLSKDYPFGTTISMGPGYLPRILSCGLVALGVIIALLGVYRPGHRISLPRWRPLICVLSAIVAFALIVPSYGLVAGSMATAGLTLLGSRERIHLQEAAILLIVLTSFTVLLFAYLLKQPIPIWWWDR